ncbi:hypothetical protein VULLAG_LOCUS2391 [Vulpes lagopus]
MAAEGAGWGPAQGGRRKAVAEEPRPLSSACCALRACLSRRRRRLPARLTVHRRLDWLHFKSSEAEENSTSSSAKGSSVLLNQPQHARYRCSALGI